MLAGHIVIFFLLGLIFIIGHVGGARWWRCRSPSASTCSSSSWPSCRRTSSPCSRRSSSGWAWRWVTTTSTPRGARRGPRRRSRHARAGGQTSERAGVTSSQNPAAGCGPREVVHKGHPRPPHKRVLTSKARKESHDQPRICVPLRRHRRRPRRPRRGHRHRPARCLRDGRHRPAAGGRRRHPDHHDHRRGAHRRRRSVRAGGLHPPRHQGVADIASFAVRELLQRALPGPH